MLAQDENFVPIPGTKHVQYVEENAVAANLEIPPEQLRAAGEIFTSQQVLGDRYASAQMISLDPDQ